jgi:NodT family efflux transporter outer membrane factor (OMF) lipoprotein
MRLASRTSRGAIVTQASVVIACLAACHAGPNYHAPALPPGADSPLVSLDTTLETSAPPPQAWWRLYEDPRLDELVREALTANRDLAAADANFVAARAALAAVHGERYPATEAIVGGVYGRDPVTEEILELGGQRPQRLWILEDVFQASYEVDLFGRIHRGIEQASANAESVAAARDAVRVVVAAETARAYAQICALGEQLAVARRSLEIVTREAEIAEQRYQAGGNSQFDVERSRALVYQVSATIPQLDGLRRATLFEVTAVLGRTPANAPRELDACVAPPRLSALIPVGDGRTLISRRPDVRQAERRLASATAAIGVATAELYPTIRLTGFYGGAATTVPQLTTNAGLVWGLGPSISWSFPNQVGARARVRQAKAVQVAALASFDSVVLTALKETEQALSTYRAALDNRQALVDAQGSIHRSFEIARDGLAAGSLSSLDLLTTEQQLVALDAAVASSDAALVQDQIAVFKALGGGWQREASPAR